MYSQQTPILEVILVEGTEPASNDHHGGGLSFGPDKMLYWSTGDNVCCSVLDGGDFTGSYEHVRQGSAPRCAQPQS